MSDNTKHVYYGMKLSTTLFIVFLILKLTGVIEWSWFWVIFPLWIGPAIGISLILIFFIITAIFS